MSRGEPRAARAGFATLVVLGLSVAVTAPGRADDRSDRAEIRAVFDSYKAALIAGDGEAAAARVDRATLQYFRELKDLALGAERDQVDARPFIDRLLIVSIRHVMEPAAISEMGLAELIERAVSEGWISPATIAQLEMGEVTIEGDEASGQVLSRSSAVATPSAPSPVEGLVYRFRREQGEWRFGFSSLVDGLNRVVAELTTQLGSDQDELIFVLVEAFSGRKVLPEVWEPPR